MNTQMTCFQRESLMLGCMNLEEILSSVSKLPPTVKFVDQCNVVRLDVSFKTTGSLVTVSMNVKVADYANPSIINWNNDFEIFVPLNSGSSNSDVLTQVITAVMKTRFGEYQMFNVIL